MFIKNGIAKQRDYIHLAFDRLAGNAAIGTFLKIFCRNNSKNILTVIFFYNMFDYLNSEKNIK